MLRYLAPLCLLALPAEAAIYNLAGDGTCTFQNEGGYYEEPCSASAEIHLDSSLYGIATPYEQGATMKLYRQDGIIEYGFIGWDDSYAVGGLDEGICYDVCADISTDSVGNLLWLHATCYQCLPDTYASYWYGLGGWEFSHGLTGNLVHAQGGWTLITTPIPGSMVLLLGALGMLGLWRRL